MVDSSRQDKHEESILLWRTQPQLRTRPKQQRPNIHRRPRPMRRDKLRIQTHRQMNTPLKMLDRHLRHRHERGRMLHPLSVLPGTEDVDRFVIRGAEGFEAFVALLAVV